MKTWYLMGQVTKRRDLPARIRETARRLGCLPDLESIRFEKGWSRARNGQGVYCGIGFADTRPDDADDAPEPPFDVETLVSVLRMSLIDRTDVVRSILPHEQAEAFTQESLMSGEQVIHVARTPPPDPEELSIASERAHEAESVEEAREQYDRLLAWLSCLRAGSWGQFVDAVRSLGIDRLTKPGDVLVRLMLLGHLEIAAGGRRWSVNPPMLCEAADGGWFLCGQRDHGMQDALSAHPSTEYSAQPYGTGPDRIRVEAEARSEIEMALRRADVRVLTIDRVAMRLAEALPSGAEWAASVRQNLHPELSDVLVHRIDPVSGELESLRPVAGTDGSLSVPAGLYVITSEQGRGRSVRVYCDENRSWTRCDWYGMAYLEQRRRGELRAYKSDGVFVLPPDSPWPRVFDRALVLASGLLPVHVPGRGRLFTTHTSAAPETLSEKLGVNIQALEGTVQ